ncbi:MAG: transglutaminase family protein [Anaeromyxobacter sp.]
MDPYLRPTDVIDWEHPVVRALGNELSASATPRADGARAEQVRRLFEWVRHRVTHTMDLGGGGPVTCSASEVATRRTSICFGKSHLLVALLRASGLRAGFCYQRLTENDRFFLHGLTAVQLPGLGWYRLDPRGGFRGTGARFSPPNERLVYTPTSPGEWDSREVLADPLPEVVEALRAAPSLQHLAQALPDRVEPPRGLARAIPRPERRRVENL